MTSYCSDYSRSYAHAGRGLPTIEPGMPVPAGTGMSRRSLMLRSFGLGVAVYGGATLTSAQAVEAAINDATGQHRVIVSVHVDGGWDGMSVLSPQGSDQRHVAALTALRPGLVASVPKTGLVDFGADRSLAWHPAATGLRALWDEANVGVAVAPAIGYAGANYSHFTSRHFWETGALNTGGTTGWMGRYLDRVGQPNVPIQGLTVGSTLSPALATSNVPVAAIREIDTYKFTYTNGSGSLASDANSRLLAMASAATGDAQRDQARLTGRASLELVNDLALAKATAASPVAYPTEASAFASNLRSTARLLSTTSGTSYLPIRCVALKAHGTFDTHGSQEPNFSTNLKITSDAIRAFWADLKARGQDDRVVMLVWSEFGRRPQENGSNGCDHGAAGSAFVIGRSVKQGLIGEFPGLKAYGTLGAGLMQDGNLRATSDFRGIYSALLEQWMGTDAEGIIPGAGLKPGTGAFARPALF